MMYTIKQMCQDSGLSRSTILYYDSIGLLKPSQRTSSNYRMYSEEDRLRLMRICTFKEAGIPLEQIKEHLDKGSNREAEVLTEKLQTINQEIRELRLRQKLIVELLKTKYTADAKLVLNEDTFVELLDSMGFDEKQREHFHRQFEQNDPEAHELFLTFLGMDEEQIKEIKERLNN